MSEHKATTGARADRAFTRIPVHVQAVLRPEGGGPIQGVVHDLSFNGVSIDAPGVHLDAGTECELELVLDGGAGQIRLPAHGRVIRASQGSVALHLSAVDGDVYEHFERLLLYNARNPGTLEDELRDHAGDQPSLRDPDSRD